MSDIKITVLQRTVAEDLMQKYGAKELTICDQFKEGDVFISKNGSRPENFTCGEAWHSFGKYAFALAHGANGFWENWIPERKISINSCNDGLRPVIFKLEVIDDE